MNRQLALRAIKIAAKSKNSSQTSPRVGALLVATDQSIVTAYRGEKREGDHAEFTLIHKKVRSSSLLRSSTLYTTLEPCTARAHDRRPCADWIIARGIRRVVIGILDPNPDICGRGYWKLLDAGIQVEFFPTDLAMQVMNLNRDFIDLHRKERAISVLLENFLQRHKSPLVAPYSGLSWGDELSLQDAPEIREGWSLESVGLQYDATKPFSLPTEYRTSYRQYFSENYGTKKFNDDGEKLMISENPRSFSDAPTLDLTVRSCRYSEVCFYRDHVAHILGKKKVIIEGLLRGTMNVDFAHGLCLHTIISTADHKLLLTKRSNKVEFYPGTWSCSVEETLSKKDFLAGGSSPMVNWVKRLLHEELSLSEIHYRTDRIRVLSVFLETDSLNVSLCALTPLEIESDLLSTRLQSHPRTDYEFTDWVYLDFDRQGILREIASPTRNYHPSTPYRFLWAFVKRFGLPADSDLGGVIDQALQTTVV